MAVDQISDGLGGRLPIHLRPKKISQWGIRMDLLPQNERIEKLYNSLVGCGHFGGEARYFLRRNNDHSFKSKNWCVNITNFLLVISAVTNWLGPAQQFCLYRFKNLREVQLNPPHVQFLQPCGPGLLGWCPSVGRVVETGWVAALFLGACAELTNCTIFGCLLDALPV